MSTRSCKYCPSMIQAWNTQDQSTLYGKAINMSTCRTRGLIIKTLDMTGDQEIDRAAELAEHCPQFGLTPQSDKITLKIGVAAPEEPKKNPGPAKTCRACYFYSPGVSVKERTGIGMGACMKFGQLIPDVRAADIAKNCGASVRAEVENPSEHHKMLIDSLTIDPQLNKYLFPAEAEQGPALDTSIEPSTYPTDRPVTPKQDEAGIRAWRKLTSGGKEVFLPIFRADFFSDEERSKIPTTGDQEHPETYVDHMSLAFTVAALWFHLDETPALHGKAGTGKTEFFRYMAWLMQIPFERISITGESEKDDLAGKMHFENNETVFKPGRIVKAWTKPNVVVLDEPNTGPPEVWQFIRPLTDNSKQLVNDTNEGELIARHKFAFLGMAMNPAWDPRNVGAEVLGDADGSRLMHIFVDMPPEHIERSIIQERCDLDGYKIEDNKLDSITTIAKAIRELSDNNELPITWGVRNQIKVARATAWFSMEKAYNLAILDYLEPETKEMVMNIVGAELKKGRRR